MAAIEILKGFSDGTLKLSDDGYTEVSKGNSIKWKITDESDSNSLQVKSFKIRIKSDSNDEIFSEVPSEDGKEWKAKIKDHGVAHKTCKYAIHWTDINDKPYIFDPIIAVKP